MPWYSQGTVDVTTNSDTVTGTGTAFSANSRVGDAFRGPDGRWYEVTNIASATVLSISPAYVGESVSAGSYSIAPMQGYVKESADRLRRVVDEFGALLAELGTYGPTLKIDAVGLLADRDQYDSASAGFTFYASDSEQLYLKLSSTLGDWSAGAPVARGPAGEKGDTGDVTPEAIAARDTAQAAADSASEDAQLAAASAAAVAEIGAGWTPVIAVVPDGERLVMQVADWTGGESNKPESGVYVGVSGFVETAAEAINIRPDGGGTVSSVNGALPDANGNVELDASSVGALAEGATATDSARYAGLLPPPNDGKQYALKDGAWVEVAASGGAEWGSIDGTLSDQADLMAALAAEPGLGWGQTWQDMKALRSAGTVYTNTTGKVIQLSVGWYSSGASGFQIRQPGGAWIQIGDIASDAYRVSTAAVVPVGWEYRLPGGVINYWAELR